jgi:hypothetical protein
MINDWRDLPIDARTILGPLMSGPWTAKGLAKFYKGIGLDRVRSAFAYLHKHGLAEPTRPDLDEPENWQWRATNLGRDVYGRYTLYCQCQGW